jgi:hypothetical protein
MSSLLNQIEEQARSLSAEDRARLAQSPEHAGITSHINLRLD